MPAVDFYFDPACPWTWMTSRWLVDAAALRDVTVGWHSLSLLVLSEGEAPEQYADVLRAAARAHRLFAALDDAGRNDLVGRVYEAIGEATHQRGEHLDDDIVRRAAEQAGAGEWATALDDPVWDAAVEASTKEAVDLAGPDIGSPVLAFGRPRVGLFGPIVSPGPRGEAAARLLDLVLEAGAIPGFFELKRGRSAPPELPAPAWS
ncbi:MAG TPA: DsbA family protein [Acidimicrobiales bacterium]|nr:DsbA family protein [Acidimicrobiales bacterium]